MLKTLALNIPCYFFLFRVLDCLATVGAGVLLRSSGCAFFILKGDFEMERRYELFGQKLAYCREAMKFSKKDMAGLISVSPSTYYKYEKGITMPPVYNLHLLAIITDMPMEAYADFDFSLELFIDMYNTTPLQRFLELHEDVMNKTIDSYLGDVKPILCD